MSTHPKSKPAPPLAPCSLPHHDVDQRVEYRQWDARAHSTMLVTGTVAAHCSLTRRITIRTARGVVTTECGHVTPEGKT